MRSVTHKMEIVEAAKPPDNRPKGARYSPPPNECAEAKAVMCYDRSDEIEDRARDMELAIHQHRYDDVRTLVNGLVNMFDAINCDFTQKAGAK